MTQAEISACPRLNCGGTVLTNYDEATCYRCGRSTDPIITVADLPKMSKRGPMLGGSKRYGR